MPNWHMKFHGKDFLCFSFQINLWNQCNQWLISLFRNQISLMYGDWFSHSTWALATSRGVS